MSCFGHLLQDAKCHIYRDIWQYVYIYIYIYISHVRHKGSSVTHNLTRHVLHVTGFLVWIEDVPPVLLYVII